MRILTGRSLSSNTKLPELSVSVSDNVDCLLRRTSPRYLVTLYFLMFGTVVVCSCCPSYTQHPRLVDEADMHEDNVTNLVLTRIDLTRVLIHTPFSHRCIALTQHARLGYSLLFDAQTMYNTE